MQALRAACAEARRLSKDSEACAQALGPLLEGSRRDTCELLRITPPPFPNANSMEPTVPAMLSSCGPSRMEDKGEARQCRFVGPTFEARRAEAISQRAEALTAELRAAEACAFKDALPSGYGRL
jgi:hypothetical protein